MTDWATISSMATAGATLVLAVGTFASVRSANKAARTAERALLAGLRPVLVPSRLEDPPDKIAWADNHWTRLTGGRASIELVDGHIYLAMSLRNVGSGIAVLQGWHPALDWNPGGSHAELDQFRRQGRDLFVAAGGLGFWQGAVHDGGDELHLVVCEVARLDRANVQRSGEPLAGDDRHREDRLVLVLRQVRELLEARIEMRLRRTHDRCELRGGRTGDAFARAHARTLRHLLDTRTVRGAEDELVAAFVVEVDEACVRVEHVGDLPCDES